MERGGETDAQRARARERETTILASRKKTGNRSDICRMLTKGWRAVEGGTRNIV